nr:transposase [Hymenolepis microstoma]
MLCVWWGGQLGVIYYELPKPSETITGERYRTPESDAPEPCPRKKKNGHSTRRDTIRLFYRPPHVAKVVVKKYHETLKWEILPHPPYSPDVAPSADFHLARWHTARFTSTSARMKKLEKLDQLMDIMERRKIFSPWDSLAAREMGPSGS